MTNNQANQRAQSVAAHSTVDGAGGPSAPTASEARLRREAWCWLVLGALLGAAGISKGIHLVTLLAWIMLAVCALNYLAARHRRGTVQIRHWLPDAVFASSPFSVSLEIANTAKKAAYGILVIDRGPSHRLSWFIPLLKAKAKELLTGNISLTTRGLYQWDHVRASSSFPFGLAVSSTCISHPGSITVFPALGRLHRGRFRHFVRQGADTGGFLRQRQSLPHPIAQGELHGVRAFRNGDSPRWIHWRTSARRGELMVREFERTPNENLILIVEAWCPASSDGRRYEPLEDLLSFASTVCWECARHSGEQFVLGVAGLGVSVIAGATGRKFTLGLLEQLASEKGNPDPDLGVLIRRLIAARPAAAPVLVLSTRGANLARQLSNQFRRRVASIVLDGDDWKVDFYEKPAACTA